LDPDKIATVKSLLAMAADQEGTEEGDNALDKAMRWMAKYSIDRAMLDAHREGPATSEPVRSIHDLPGGAFSEERAHLASNIAAILRVENLVWIIGTGTRKKHCRLAMVGYPEDIDTAVMLIDLIEAQLQRLLRRARRSTLYRDGTANEKRRLIASIILGWEQRITQRLAEAYRREEQRHQAPGAVVLRRRHDEVAKLAEEVFPPKDDIPPLKETKRAYSEGFEMGRQAANLADLAQTRVDNTPHTRGALNV